MNDTLSTLRKRPRRLPIRLRVDRSTLPAFLDSEIMNLSKGGVFIQADLPLPTGSEIDFEFTLPASGRVISAVGVVIWVRKRGTKAPGPHADHPAGMGIQFKKLEPVDIEAILDEIEGLIDIP